MVGGGGTQIDVMLLVVRLNSCSRGYTHSNNLSTAFRTSCCAVAATLCFMC